MHAEIHGSGIVGGSQTRRLNKMSKKRRALEASLGLNDGTQVESMIKDCSSIQSINNLEDPGMVNFQKISKISKISKNFKNQGLILYHRSTLIFYQNFTNLSKLFSLSITTTTTFAFCFTFFFFRY